MPQYPIISPSFTASVLPAVVEPRPAAYGRRVRDPITALERAIRSLPEPTRVAMLEGIRRHPIVCGAYTDGKGGVCPMLRAHRHGGRVTLLAFARSWDAFARTKRVRRATPRELRTLEDLLVASLAEEPSELAAAIAEYQASRSRREFPEIRAGRLSGSRRSGPRAGAGG